MNALRIIVMLNKVKHLHGIAVRCREMLPCGQHDMDFMAHQVRPVILIMTRVASASIVISSVFQRYEHRPPT